MSNQLISFSVVLSESLILAEILDSFILTDRDCVKRRLVNCCAGGGWGLVCPGGLEGWSGVYRWAGWPGQAGYLCGTEARH